MSLQDDRYYFCFLVDVESSRNVFLIYLLRLLEALLVLSVVIEGK